MMRQASPLNIRDAIITASKWLKAAGIEEARTEAWHLLTHVRRQDRATLLAQALDPLTDQDQKAFEEVTARRAAREPMAQIVGRKEFWSLEFLVSSDVLCPRADSETLIEASLQEMDRRDGASCWDGRILDLGTGSGCLLLALLSECRAAHGVGLDISLAALQLARSNGERLGLADRVRWVCGSWGAALGDRGFDLILCNPPYIAEGEAGILAPEILLFEPASALFAGEDGLDAYRRLGRDLQRLLAPEGFACLEIGAGQADAVEALVEKEGLIGLGRRRDLAGIERCLIVGRR